MTNAMKANLVLSAEHKNLHQDEDGSEPWIVMSRNGRCRYGAHGFPLPGVGCFVVPATPCCHVLLLECAPILGSGITLHDAMGFFESENGADHIKSDGVKLVSLPMGRICWVPYGWCAAPLGWSQKDVETDATMTVISYFHEPWWAELPGNVRAGICELNTEHFHKMKSTPVFASRAELFNKLFQELF